MRWYISMTLKTLNCLVRKKKTHSVLLQSFQLQKEKWSIWCYQSWCPRGKASSVDQKMHIVVELSILGEVWPRSTSRKSTPLWGTSCANIGVSDRWRKECPPFWKDIRSVISRSLSKLVTRAWWEKQKALHQRGFQTKAST